MGVGPVSGTQPSGPPSWKLAAGIAEHTQALVVSGLGSLPYGRALFLSIDEATQGGAWLRLLLALAPVTDAGHASTPGRVAAMAFTYTGLQRMGIGAQTLASFGRPFREGMFQEDRLRRLGDRRDGAWCETAINPNGPAPQGPLWSANTPLKDPLATDLGWVGGFDVPHEGAPEAEMLTPKGIHVLLLLYTARESEAEDWSDRVKAALPGLGLSLEHELDLLLDVQKTDDRISREHFGFADGLSQPAPFGLPAPIDETACVLLNGTPAPKHPVQGVPLGEILIGYQNGHSEPAPGPVVPQDPRAAEAGLVSHPRAEGFADLGLNGSYMVVRELRQDVAAFWQSLRANAERIRAADPSSSHITETWLAERITGRGVDGHLLCPGPMPYAKPDQWGLPDNDFLFHKEDRHGFGCPVGSHVRRAFPRDALAPDPSEESRQALLQSANNHRILRRGRKFGPVAADRWTEDGRERGLLFMCLNTDIERQFEFVQQTWLLNETFATLFKETDPLLGPAGKQTLRGKPIRYTVDVRTYVQMAGGDYFFLPSMPALRYLSLL